jgi:hypothetical protein
MYKKIDQELNGASWYTGYMGANGQYFYRREARVYLELVEVVTQPAPEASSRGVWTENLLGDGE